MQQYQGYGPVSQPVLVANTSAEEQSAFMRKVYFHIAGAFAVFLIAEGVLQSLPMAERMAAKLNDFWLLVILGFWVVGFIASKWTTPGLPLSQQYLGLGLYALGEAVIFMPLIAYIRFYQDENILITGFLVTLALIVGLSLIAMDPRTNFSILRGALMIGFPLMLALIVGGILFGFGLGTWFSVFAIVLASASILYQTDQIVKRARTDSYVSAALGLFASFMLLLWYVIRLLGVARR